MAKKKKSNINFLQIKDLLSIPQLAERIYQKNTIEAKENKSKKTNKSKIDSSQIKNLLSKQMYDSPKGGGRAGGVKPSTLLEGKLPGKKKFRIGGHVKKKRIDGIAKKGKTRGTII
tara:strand:- start:141 stop:488 length:348 start_codon:yes stop_codon:yes gene_type:complete